MSIPFVFSLNILLFWFRKFLWNLISGDGGRWGWLRLIASLRGGFDCEFLRSEIESWMESFPWGHSWRFFRLLVRWGSKISHKNFWRRGKNQDFSPAKAKESHFTSQPFKFKAPSKTCLQSPVKILPPKPTTPKNLFTTRKM